MSASRPGGESGSDVGALAGSAARTMAAECLCFRARRVSRLITRVYDEALRPLGIHATQLTLLNAITLLGRSGGATVARLSDVLAMDQTTLSRNVRPLRTAGLVDVDRGEDDRRVRVFRVTDAGARVVADALPLWARAHERLLDSLGVAPAAELRERLDAAAVATRPLERDRGIHPHPILLQGGRLAPRV